MPQGSTNQPALEFHGKPTFAGILMLYWAEISTGWNDETDQQYRHFYYDFIIPFLLNHDILSIDMLRIEDFQHCIKSIEKKGYLSRSARQDYAPPTIDKLWYLIRVAVEIGARHYLCCNIFRQSQTKKRRKIDTDEKMILRRSLSPAQQILAEKLLLTDPLQSGERMGLALMLALGLRDAEACGLNYEDIRPIEGHSDIHFAWIYKSTQLGSNQQQASGKTWNADRLIPVSTAFWSLIESRRKHLASLGLDPSELPIACRRNNYTVRCSADDLTEAAHPFFAELGISFGQLDCIRNVIQGSTSVSVYGHEVCEKAPTAYLLRRNFATKLAYKGLSIPEICYVLGHNIEDPSESRNEFLADEKLCQIWVKTVSEPYTSSSPKLLPSSSVFELDGISYNLQLPPNCQKVSLRISANEPLESIHLRISGTDIHLISQELLCFHQKIHYPSTVNIVNEHSHLFRKEI